MFTHVYANVSLDQVSPVSEPPWSTRCTDGVRTFGQWLSDDVDVESLARAGEGMTGADLAEVLRRARLAKAMREARTGAPEPAIGQADLMHHLRELGREAVK